MEQQFLPFAAAHLAPDSSQQPCGLPAHACKVCSQCWLEQIAVCYELMWSMTTIVSGAALQLSLGYAANVQGQQQFSTDLAISLSRSMDRSSFTMKMRSKRDRMVVCRSMFSWQLLRSSYLQPAADK